MMKQKGFQICMESSVYGYDGIFASTNQRPSMYAQSTSPEPLTLPNPRVSTHDNKILTVCFLSCA